MSRIKNAIREHYVAPYNDGTPPDAGEYLRLARFIESVTDSTEEETEDIAYYDGDGTIESNVIGIGEAWDFAGFWDQTDEAQVLIKNMKRKTDEERIVWHKIIETDGTVVEAPASVLSIVAGSGDASAFEEFSCTLRYRVIATETTI